MIPHQPDSWPVRYGDLTEDTQFSWYQGHWDSNGPVMREEVIPKGTTVKITMVSRFGDVGVTTDFTTERGNYGARVEINKLENLRKDL